MFLEKNHRENEHVIHTNEHIERFNMLIVIYDMFYGRHSGLEEKEPPVCRTGRRIDTNKREYKMVQDNEKKSSVCTFSSQELNVPVVLPFLITNKHSEEGLE